MRNYCTFGCPGINIQTREETMDCLCYSVRNRNVISVAGRVRHTDHTLSDTDTGNSRLQIEF